MLARDTSVCLSPQIYFLRFEKGFKTLDVDQQPTITEISKPPIHNHPFNATSLILKPLLYGLNQQKLVQLTRLPR